jgi:sugar phosphate permease
MDSVESRDVAHRASERVSGGGGSRADSRESWRTAWLVLAILSVSYASPLVIVVGMKPMQEALGTDRSVLALAGSLVWVGTGSGGILMGWLADRIGVRRTVSIGAVMIAAGLALSSIGCWSMSAAGSSAGAARRSH